MKNYSQFIRLLTEATEQKYDFLDQFDIMTIDDFMRNAKTLEPKDDVKEAVGDMGAEAKPFADKDVPEYFDRIKSGTKTKKDKLTMPYIHGSNIPITDEAGKPYDLKKLKNMITSRPKTLLKQNTKIVHSGGDSSMYYNLSLPALTGLAVNEETDEFIIVNTCPGAGECKMYCYAMKGGYVQYPAPSLTASRVLTFLLNDPNGFAAKLNNEIKAEQKKNDKKKVKTVVRWHDAGDFFSPQYMNLAFDVARANPKVDFYAYTKVSDVVNSPDKPENFVINFSEGAKGSETKLVNLPTTKKSIVVAKDMFWDLVKHTSRQLIKDKDKKMQYNDENSVQELKQRIADKFKLDVNNIITYSELMTTPKGEEPKWSVIVAPGDGDDAANRKDVLNTLLLIH